MSLATDSQSLAGTIMGRYLLVRLVGEGGMGAVYEATHQELGKRVAVKTLHQRHADSPETRSRFVREGRAASRIRHPNVADVYDVGIEESHPYLVMEFLEGEELARLIAREAPLPVQRTADLLVPVVAAVAAVHDLGVVHRDLKPANIFLSAERGTIRPKVLDFGISKVADRVDASSLTDSGAILGTPLYLSPEQARGTKHADAFSDQYALGVILYECVTARRPIEEPALYLLVQRIVHGDFAPPRQVNPTIPSAFEDVVLRAMARDPAERFPTTRDFGRALLEFASAPVRANYERELGAPEWMAPHPALAHRQSRPELKPSAALETTRADRQEARADSRPHVRRAAIAAGLLTASIGWLLWPKSTPREIPVPPPEARKKTADIVPPSLAAPIPTPTSALSLDAPAPDAIASAPKTSAYNPRPPRPARSATPQPVDSTIGAKTRRPDPYEEQK